MFRPSQLVALHAACVHDLQWFPGLKVCWLAPQLGNQANKNMVMVVLSLQWRPQAESYALQIPPG
jgi:hypothetical protein